MIFLKLVLNRMAFMQISMDANKYFCHKKKAKRKDGNLK